MALTNQNVPRSEPAQRAPLPVSATDPGVAIGVQDVVAQLPVTDTISIVARPLSDPDFLNLKPRNPMHQLYWANRSYQGGIRTDHRLAQGFRAAKKEDALDVPAAMIDPTTGNIVRGDLILMIIGRNAYEGALLYNHNKAKRRVNRFGVIESNETGPVDAIKATIAEVPGTPLQRSKISTYYPTASELGGMLDGGGSTPQKG